MSSVLAWADLRTRFTAAAIGVPVAWPNEPFDPVEPPGPFLLVELAGGSSRPIELGGGIWQSRGRAFVHILVPVGAGLARVHELADAIEAAFRSAPLEPVVYDQVDTDPGGVGEEDGNYWRTSVTADWHLQTFVSRG